MKTKHAAILLTALLSAACSSGQKMHGAAGELTPRSWVETMHKPALAAYAKAATPAEFSEAMDLLLASANAAPAEAKALAARDACLGAYATGDTAVMEALDCANGPLKLDSGD